MKESASTLYQQRTCRLYDVRSRLKIVGRSPVSADGVACDWSAAGLEFTADCEGDVTVRASGALTGVHQADGAYFTVYLDGERLPEALLVVADSDEDITIAAGLPRGRHTIRLIKQSHIRQQRIVFHSLTMKGELLAAPAQRGCFIEFIGDSITCGHGAKGASGDINGTDATLAFAFQTAEALNADYSLVSVGGMGLSSPCFTEKSMLDIYEYESYYRSASRKYDFARRPDLVVVNLGTNDAVPRFAIDAALFKKAVAALIGMLRQHYGELPVIWAYNSMVRDFHTYTMEVLDSLGGEAAGLYTVKFEPNTGSDGHPTAAAQAVDARILVDFIRAKGLCRA